jgi:hypothetical protein
MPFACHDESAFLAATVPDRDLRRDATQTTSPRQSIHTKDTFCSASQDRTSNEILPEPSRRMMRSGRVSPPLKKR